MPSSFPSSTHFRISLVISQPFFSVTAVLQILTWSVTFVIQCLAEARYHTLRGSDHAKSTGTPIGIGWFAIFFQLLILYRVISSVGLESEHQDSGPIAVMVAVNVVLGISCSNSSIYSRLDLVLRLYGYGWMILSTLNVTWLLYFTSSEQSKLVAFLNPTFRRKQLIRSSINLRRSASHSNINFPIITSEHAAHYAGSHDISLEAGHAAESRQSFHNEKLMNEVTAALLPSNHAYAPEGQRDLDTRHAFDFPHGEPANNNLLPSSQVLTAQHHPDPMLRLPSSHPLRQLDNSHDEPKHINPSFQQPQSPHQQDYHHLLSQSQRANCYPTQLETLPNIYQQSFPPHPPGIPKDQALTSDPIASTPLAATFQPRDMPLIDRSILNQAYREEELISTSQSESPSTASHALSRDSQPVKRAKAMYAYNASPADPNEISFDKGEILEIINYNGKWWQARRATGQSGIVPSNYLQMLPDQ